MLEVTRRARTDKYGVEWEPWRLGGSCGGCQQAFGLRPRNHCRRCGRLFCKSCQYPTLMEAYPSPNKKIVCKGCAQSDDRERVERVSRFRSIGASAPVGDASSLAPPPATDMSRAQTAPPPPQPRAVPSGAPPPQPAAAASRPAAGEEPVPEGACAICRQPLGAEMVLLDGDEEVPPRKLHKDCFVCCIDRQPIDGQFLEEDGRLYCEPHYVEFCCETCEGCSKKIHEGVATKALGAHWHHDCFICSYCSVPMADAGGGDSSSSGFNFRMHNGAVYCEKDYLEQCCDKCSGCGFPVAGGLNAMGGTWHLQCFCCHECEQPFLKMEEKSYCVLDGHPYCKEDAEAISKLSSEDRAVLHTLPHDTLSRVASSMSMATLGDRKVTGEECGLCLSYGISEALRSIAAGQTARTSVGRGTAPGQQLLTANGRPVLPVSAYKERPQWHFSLGVGEDTGLSFHFEAFAPAAFAELREDACGIKEEEYILSLSLRPLSGGKEGEGKSSSLFYFSWDQKFIVKTVLRVEVPFFLKCLREYHNHLVGPDAPRDGNGRSASLLPRFLGLYSIKFENEAAITVIVMCNVFPPRLKIPEKYDLKGVLGAQRFVSEEELAKGVKVLKDRNFVARTKHLVIGREAKERVARLIERDVRFLQEHGRMDYSLLLGIAPFAELPAEFAHMGLRCREPNGAPGPEVFFFGIIDILQEYTLIKALEGGIKTVMYVAKSFGKRQTLTNKDNAVSASSASHYGSRFAKFMIDYME